MCDVFCLLHACTNALLLWARWVKEGRDDSQIIPFHLLGDDATNSFRKFAVKEEVLVGFGVFAKMTFAISKLPVGSLLSWVRMTDEGLLEGFNLVLGKCGVVHCPCLCGIKQEGGQRPHINFGWGSGGSILGGNFQDLLVDCSV